MKGLCLSFVLGSAMALTGCAQSESPRGVVDRLTPQTAEAVHFYTFNECTGTLAGGEQSRILTFLQELQLDAEDVIIVGLPKGRNPTRDVQRRARMEQLLSGQAAQVRFIGERDFRTDCRSQSEGVIRVVRVLSVRAECLDRDIDFGCASARNLAAMLSNKSDSYLPRQTKRSLRGPSSTNTRSGPVN